MKIAEIAEWQNTTITFHLIESQVFHVYAGVTWSIWSFWIIYFDEKFCFFITSEKNCWLDQIRVNLKNQKILLSYKFIYKHLLCFNQNCTKNVQNSSKKKIFTIFFELLKIGIKLFCTNSNCPKFWRSILIKIRRKQSFWRKSVKFWKCQKSFQSSCSTSLASKCLWFNNWKVNMREICHSHFCILDRRGN